MLPHGRVHGWAEEQRLAQVPRADHTSLREKPREALDFLTPSHPSAAPFQPGCRFVSTAGLTHGLRVICSTFQPSSSLTGRKDERGYPEDKSHPAPASSPG